LTKTGEACFFLLIAGLLGIQAYICCDGFILYYKWRILMIPSEEALQLAEKDASLKTQSQMRLEMIRELMQPNIYKMNIIFVYLQFQATVRLTVYCVVRFSNNMTMTEWVPIGDVFFIVIYVTEIWITLGLFLFLCSEHKKSGEDDSDMVFERTDDIEGTIAVADSLVHTQTMAEFIKIVEKQHEARRSIIMQNIKSSESEDSNVTHSEEE